MTDPILARADALMRRKRPSEADEIPILTDAFDDDDIPLLLDIEALGGNEEPSPPAPAVPDIPVTAEPARASGLPSGEPEEDSHQTASTPASPESITPQPVEILPTPPCEEEPPKSRQEEDAPILQATPTQALPEMLLKELSERLQQRLAAELPRLIEATLREYLDEQVLAERRHD